MTGTMEELIGEAHYRIEAEPEKYHPKVYGEHEGGGTHVLYLTAQDVPFEKLGLPAVPEKPLPETSETIQHTLYKGFAAPMGLFGLFTEKAVQALAHLLLGSLTVHNGSFPSQGCKRFFRAWRARCNLALTAETD